MAEKKNGIAGDEGVGDKSIAVTRRRSIVDRSPPIAPIDFFPVGFKYDAPAPPPAARKNRGSGGTGGGPEVRLAGRAASGMALLQFN